MPEARPGQRLDETRFSGSGTGTAANTTDYFGQGNDNAALGRISTVVAIPHTARRMIFQSSVAPGAGESYTYTLMVNGIASIITAVIAGAVAVQAEDIVNEVALVRGDRLEVRIVNSLNGAQARHRATYEKVLT